jgi:antitoxin ParD1/3/4
MPTRNVILTEHHATVIDRLVTSGRYANANEVLQEGLRLLERSEELEAVKVDNLRRAVAMGMADLEQGRFVTIEDAEIESVIGDLGRRAFSSRP